MIGRVIKEKREQMGISREDFAKMIGISRDYLCMIENEKRTLSKKLLPKIAKKLRIPEKEMKIYNSSTVIFDKKEKTFLKRQIKNIDNELIELEVKKSMLEKDRIYLCGKLVKLELEGQNVK